MSRTYSLACKDCKVHLWIGQGHAGLLGHLYTTAAHIEALTRFLNSHMKHNLVFDENCEGPISEYTEIEPEL